MEVAKQEGVLYITAGTLHLLLYLCVNSADSFMKNNHPVRWTCFVGGFLGHSGLELNGRQCKNSCFLKNSDKTRVELWTCPPTLPFSKRFSGVLEQKLMFGSPKWLSVAKSKWTQGTCSEACNRQTRLGRGLVVLHIFEFLGAVCVVLLRASAINA